uniref:Uncharacterized protein n=1 Tax=Arundo donax TaxID=35708 RepID=A0A0A8YHQ2_ARUDO
MDKDVEQVERGG